MRPKLPMETDWELFKKHSFGLTLILSCILLNFLLAWFFQIGDANSASGAPVYFTMGACGAQIVSIGFFLGAAPFSFLFRLFISIALAIVFACPLLFSGLVFGDGNTGEFLEQIGVLPALILAFAAPFAMGRYFLGWRLHFPVFVAAEQESLSIKTILLGTALVAMALTLLQIGDKNELPGKVAIAMIGAGLGLLIFLPLAYFVLRSHRHWFWVIGSSQVAFWVAFGVLSLMSRIEDQVMAGPGPRMGGAWRQIGPAVSVAALILCFGLFLIAIKRSGGQLGLAHRDESLEAEAFTLVGPKGEVDPLA